MTLGILVLNSGSSSLKFGVYMPGKKSDATSDTASDSGDETPWLTGSAKGIGRDDEHDRGHVREGHRQRGSVPNGSTEVEPDSRGRRIQTVQF